MGLADIVASGDSPAIAASVRRRRPPTPAPYPDAITRASQNAAASASSTTTPTTVPATQATDTDPRRTDPVLATSPTSTVSSPLARLQALTGTSPQTSALEALIEQGQEAVQKAINASEVEPKPDTMKVAVPEFVPPEYRKYVAKFGTKYVDAPAQGTGLTGPEYLANTLQFESGFNRNAVSSAGAADLGQFMPGTAATFESEYGVDPIGGSAKDAIKGAAMHLSGQYGHPALYAGYNPGYSDSDPIVTDPGAEVNVKIREQGGLVGDPVDQGPSLTALQRFIQPNESPQEVASELGVPVDRAKIEYTKLSPDLQRALVQVARQSGDPVSLTEGFRTRARQEALASGSGGATGPAAAPGTSQHEFGQAVDVSLTPEQRAIAEQVGLVNTVSGEPWHYEIASDEGYAPAGAPGGSSPAAGGFVPPGSSVTAGGSYVPAASGTTPLEDAAGGRVALERKPQLGISPISNPLSARAVLPQGFAGSTDGETLSALQALLAGDTGAPADSALAGLLAALIPQRRR